MLVSRTSRLVALVISLLLMPGWAPVGGARQPETGTNAADDQALIQQVIQEITRRVIEELQSGDFLREQIRLGIEEYIRDQETARAAARAEQTRLANERAKNVRPISPERDHIYGSLDAVISLIEYSDFECPFCKSLHATLRELVKASAGRVNWVFRHFPLSMHDPGARREAEASECAAALGGNDAFWAYGDAIFARTRSNGSGFPLTDLVPLAVELGLDEDEFEECLDSRKYAERVQEDVTEGTRIGVDATPVTILLHHRTGEVRLRTGAQPLAVFEADIDTMLKQDPD